MLPSSVRAVVFDFGGVLWDMRWDVARELDRAHGLPRSSVFETLYRSETWRAVERGAGDPDAWRREAHRALEARAGRPLPPLHEEWRKSQAAIEPNVDASLRHRLEHEIGIRHLFDDIVCSAEIGMAKPEPAVFDLACGRLGLAPGECVFVDDYEVNVKAAEGLGMRGVLFRIDRGDDLGAQLAAVGVTPRGWPGRT
jgi:FMN phosphatase YigB (HAD superfamily)